MMNYIIALLFLVTNTVHARTYTTVKAEIMDGVLAPRNYVLNHEFEVNDRNVTDASNIASRTTTQPLSGGASLEIDATASAQVVKLPLRSFDRGLNGKSCEAFFTYHRDASLYKIYVEQNSVAVSGTATQLENVPIAGGRKTPSLFFPCGDNTYTTYVVIESTDNAADVIKVDEFYAGQAVNIGTVQQAQYFGSLTYAGATNCTWTVGSTTFVAPAADTDCSAASVAGSLTAPATKILAFEGNFAPGVYKIDFNTANFHAVDGVGWQCKLVAGSTDSSIFARRTRDDATDDYQSLMSFTLNLTAPYSGSVGLQCKAETTTTVQFLADRANLQARFDVYYFPSQAQTVLRMDNADYDWTTYTPTYTNLGAATAEFCQHSRKGPDLHIRCKFTTGSVGSGEPRISLPGSLLISSSKVPTLQRCGTLTRANGTASSAREIAVLCTGGNGYVNFQTLGDSGGTNPLTNATNASTVLSNSEGQFFTAVIPIEGWTTTGGSGLIVLEQRVAVMKDVKANGTAGGTSTTSYAARNLNTLEDPSGVIKNPSSFTGTDGTNTSFQLSAGTYRINAAIPGYRSSYHKARLQNTTDGTTTLIGAHYFNNAGSDYAITASVIKGIFTITGTKTFEIQHRVASALATTGYGLASSFGDTEVYSVVEIERLR